MFRGIAAILVLLLHITRSFPPAKSHYGFLFSFFNFGGSGVDFFFVLSGFIISYSSVQLLRENRIVTYIKNRVQRIYPIYWAVFILLLIPHLIFPGSYKSVYPTTVGNLLPAILLLPNHNMINGVSWTLSYEIFFYLIFLVFFSFKNLTSGFVMIIAYCFFIFFNAFVTKFTGFIFSPLIIEFFLGIAAFFLIQKELNKHLGIPVMLTGCFLFLLSAVLIFYGIVSENTELDRLFYFGVPSFLIVYGSVLVDRKRQSTIPGLMLLTGDASYSLYLIHLPIVIVLLKGIGFLHLTGFLFTNIYCLLLFLAVVTVSILFHLFVEKPMLKFLKNSSKKTPIRHNL